MRTVYILLSSDNLPALLVELEDAEAELRDVAIATWGRRRQRLEEIADKLQARRANLRGLSGL